jgi:predicted metal-dependent phosphoesterase TrpH
MADAISTIRDAGGIAVLAHPYLTGLTDPTTFESFLQTLKTMGLMGIEAVYPGHPKQPPAEYCRLARKYNLLITGGTDFHGESHRGFRWALVTAAFMYPILFMKIDGPH